MGYLKRVKFAVALLLVTCSGNPAIFSRTNLDHYIEKGLASNHALQQKLTNYRHSIEEINEARGMFFPAISILARYSVSRGGRVIELPLGDLLNAPYSTLNTLSAIHNLTDPATGLPVHFPSVENQEFLFLRPREHDTRVELVQPIYNRQIYFNHKVRQNLASAKEADAGAYKRYLVAEIKSAYYNHLKSTGINKLVENTLILLEENLRVNERLHSNNLVTVDYIYRSQAELAKMKQQQSEAQRMEKSTAAYLNFLVNNPLDTPVETDYNYQIPENIVPYKEASVLALSSRDEIVMINNYSMAANNSLRAKQSNKLPSVFGVINYGFQGEKYDFSRDHDYTIATVALRWDIFSGMQNNSRIRQAQLELLELKQKEREIEEGIRLEVINAWYSLQAARQGIEAAEAQAQANRKAFDVTSRRYSEGEVTLIEFIDTRTAMTNAEENLIIAEYDYLISLAEYELAAGLYSFDR
jgi:outer membrane protein